MKRILLFGLIVLIGGTLIGVRPMFTDEKKCLDCHAKLVQKTFIHPPAQEDCLKCHQSNGETHPQEDVEGFLLAKEVPELCYNCHNQDSLLKAYVHPPMKEGDCFSCHDIHSSKNEHLLIIQPPSLCFSCHTDLKDSITHSVSVHGALNQKKSCLNCHSPHSSPFKKWLLDEQPALCFSCHDKPMTVKDSSGTEHTITNMKQLIETSKYVHGAVENNGCAICHNPHASSNPKLWKKNFPPGNYAEGRSESFALCFQCHEKEMLEDSLTTEDTGFRNGNRNLHYVHVHKDKGRSCINCHNPHASNNLYLITDKTKFGNWEMPIRYARIQKGGSCWPGCHVQIEYHR